MFKEEVNKQFAKLEKNNTHGPLCLGYVLFMFSSYVSLINIFLKKFTTYVGMDGVDGVDDVDDVKPKLMLYDSLRGKKGKSPSIPSMSSSKKPTCPT